jgi:hypothetical protein
MQAPGFHPKSPPDPLAARLPVVGRNSQEGIRHSYVNHVNGEYIPLAEIRKQRRIAAVLTKDAGRCERKCGLTRRVFFQTLRRMIATLLTMTNVFDYWLCGGQETDAAGKPGKLAGKHRSVALIDSANIRALTRATSGPQSPVRTEEFSVVGVFDVDWLLEPRFQRLLDNMAAWPMRPSGAVV